MTKKIIYILLIFVAVILFNNCDESINGSKEKNLPPETSLFLYPDSTISQQPSKLTINWWGDDPDGIVVGYYYRWNDDEWKFTDENEISFALQIGASDTLYNFEVSAVDNSGNGKYDKSIVQNGVNYGAEPFEDLNDDNIYNEGEPFTDIGIIDPTPAVQKFPIKNTTPTIEWNQLTSLPAESFPVMTLGWNADDLDGAESIKYINIALNDSTQTVSLNGEIRNITIKIENIDAINPLMEIMVNGNLIEQKLPGIKLDAENVIYVQAEDISGAKSKFIKLPGEENAKWFVHKPKGKLLVIDDNTKNDNSANFYSENLNALQNGTFTGKYDIWDIHKYEIPYKSITFMETIKLFDVLLWYSDNQPDIDLASTTIKKFTDNGGKVLFTTVLPHPVDIVQLKDFLPIDSVSTPIKFLKSNVTIQSLINGYPELKTTGSSIKVKMFYPSSASATSIYEVTPDANVGTNVIGFKSNDNKIFFFGLPLHECDGNVGNVKQLLEKIIFGDFGLSI
jgi:hypothetical protein